MASEQWLLNDTSVAVNAYFTAQGSSYKLRNVFSGTSNRRTTSPLPYEGAGYYPSGVLNDGLGRFYTSGGAQLTGGTYYLDTYFYLTSYPANRTMTFMVCGNISDILFSWPEIFSDGSLGISSYELVNNDVTWVSTAASFIPLNSWFRLAVKTNYAGINEVKLFKGTNINGRQADATLTVDFSTIYPFAIFGATEYWDIAVDNTSNTPAILYVDNIRLDNSDYPVPNVFSVDMLGL